jgi:lipocalin
MKVSIVLVIFLIELVLAVEYHFGSCPKVKPVQVKSMENLTGKWYDVYKYQSMFVKGKCMSFEVEASTSNTTVLITSTEIKHGEVINATRTGVIDENGALEFQFTFLKLSAKFYILDADFEHYIVAFACKSAIKMANAQIAWIWSRERYLSGIYLEKAFDVLRKNEISVEDLKQSEQENCY